MAKFHGKIGFITTKETEPGVFEEGVVIEKSYSGDLIKNAYRFESSSGVNDNINIANNISIVADTFANENFYAMRYVYFQGAKWKITNVSIQRPRLILTIGGLYNGQ